jgi:hypothetical protein
MPKYNRDESYAEIHADLQGTNIVSPRQAKPNKFALVCFNSDENDADAFITTHKTLNEIVDYIENDESEFAPSYVVDLDTGKQWEPVFSVSLEEMEDGDYFAMEATEPAAGAPDAVD